MIVNQEDEKYVVEMRIDEERLFTPYHVMNGKTVYIDHNSILVKLDNRLSTWTKRQRKEVGTMRVVV